MTDGTAGFFFCADGHAVSAPQDGLVQAAALREGLQRFLHQDRHQEGGQVSGRKMRITPSVQAHEERKRTLRKEIGVEFNKFWVDFERD